jgi:polar amino acid transport system substrate-binding protein
MASDWLTSSLIRRMSCFVLILLMLGSVPPSLAAEVTAAQTRPLRVATGTIAPFVLKQDGKLTGFSIELWSEVARRMRVDFEWVDAGSREKQLEAVRRGDADIAVSAIVMSPDREQLVDFSLSYFHSGLQIMVRAKEEDPILVTLLAIPWAAIGKLFAAAIVLMFLWANVLWFIERRRQPERLKGYVAGIGEEMWTTTLIIATGEHGERDEPGKLRRFVIASVWLMGIVLLAQLTATVTTSQTVDRLRSNIAGPRDLPGKKVATETDSIAAAYLAQRRIPFVGVASAADAVELLKRSEIQAIVFNAPTLHYWLSKSNQGDFQIVGPVFMPEMYGIALAVGSPLRKRINEALLAVYEDGTYEAIYDRWFTQSR